MSTRRLARKQTSPDTVVDWPAEPTTLQDALTRWYRANRRDLPWRGTRDPYAILVSEVMLQQTQVETVKRYYDAFLARFPDVTALADASEAEVLGAWSGLGYYRRARLLHRAAQAVRDRHGGVFPTSEEDIRALPGVGDYTAGALLSIALGKPAPAVDGNVTRVFTRLLGLEGEVESRELRATVRHAAAVLGEHKTPGDVTQGLMELGATVCVWSGPRCDGCVWEKHCRARAWDATDRIPAPRKRVARKSLEVGLALVTDGERVCMVRREGKSLFGGLLELPSTDSEPDVKPRASWAEHLKRELVDAHPTLQVGRLLSCTARTLTHRDLRLWTFEARLKPRARLPGGAVMLPLADLGEAPLSTAMRAALKDALAAWEAL
ncbi:MAG: A/G-specific adenine glycosylase [Myxococcota bacterium]